MAANSITARGGGLELSSKAYASLSEDATCFANGEDALHTVLERLLKKPRSAHRGYLLSAVRNASVDIWRANATRDRYEGEYAASLSQVADDSPQDRLQSEHLAEALGEVIDALSELDQTLFERRFLGGETIKNIAAEMKLHSSTVEKRLKNIKQQCFDVVSAHRESD